MLLPNKWFISIEIDDCDYDLAQYQWRVDSNGYVIRWVDGIITYLHKIVAQRMNLIGEIDHKDRKKLNNKRDNLRLCEHSQNISNTGLRINSSTGFIGVSYSKRDQKFQAYIWYKSRKISAGNYSDPVDAATARDRLAKLYHKEFAVLNFG